MSLNLNCTFYLHIHTSTVGFVLYSDECIGKLLISKDVSIFITRDFSYEIFRLDTKGEVEVYKINIDDILK